MRVLLINVSDGGSTGRIANSLHTRLLRDGAVSAVLYGRGAKEPGRMQSTPALYANALLSRLSGRIGAFGKKSTTQLLTKLEAFAPDVVHLHNLHGYYVDVFNLLNYLKKQKIKTVFTLHDAFLFTGRCAFPGECERWHTGCGQCPKKNEYPAVWLDHSRTMWQLKQQVFSDFQTATFVSPTRWLADEARKSFLSAHPILVIPNGIEPGTFYPGKSTLRSDMQIPEERVVLAAAQDIMCDRKGGKLVLKLAETMPKTRFILVGAKGNLPVPPNVTCLAGRQSTEEMANLYRGADVFLITSREDNFPTVCLEAAACGTPIAGFACGGIPETAGAPVAEFVPYGDLYALKKAVNALFVRDNKMQNGALFAHSAETMYAAYKKVYET